MSVYRPKTSCNDGGSVEALPPSTYTSDGVVTVQPRFRIRGCKRSSLYLSGEYYNGRYWSVTGTGFYPAPPPQGTFTVGVGSTRVRCANLDRPYRFASVYDFAGGGIAKRGPSITVCRFA